MSTNVAFKYSTIPCRNMTKELISACSELYSNNYGVWSGIDESSKKGHQIRLPKSYYERLSKQHDTFVSTCHQGDQLIGHGFFLIKETGAGRKCSWVLQLVVHKDFRHQGVGSKLLQSAWGFSDYFAWGLATTNAITIKTLESVTWREVTPAVILNNLDIISNLCSNIEFVKNRELCVSEECSQVFSGFYPQFPSEESKDDHPLYTARLGRIMDGYEWLAFTFSEQPLLFSKERFDRMLDFSSSQLEDAYSRMPMGEQPWTRYTVHEINSILSMISIPKGSHVLDLGCGEGRHSIELFKRGMNVTGVDFSSRLISLANNKAKNTTVTFVEDDARSLSHVNGVFDLVVCLYDVIGSFRTYDENYAIVRQIYNHLKPGGKAVISVMNMDLTRSIAKNSVFDLSKDPTKLLKLPASNIMQASGNVFNPDYYLLEEKNHLVYRKEQFESDTFLSAEYVIADYRFTKKEIEELLTRVGFQTLVSRCVGLGDWGKELSTTDIHAKEILVFMEKTDENPVTNREKWARILGEKRFRVSEKSENDLRDPFENDYGRLISSAQVRRLQGKTQVFPLPDNDYPRTRLTHSLEVAYFGSSMGKSIERIIKDRNDLPDRFEGRLSSLLRVCGLVHDLGNTPFGHFGEVAIRDFFKHYFTEDSSLVMTEAEKADFEFFDGNVQTQRLLSKLHYFGDDKAFNLTYQTLSALMKYPSDSLTGNRGSDSSDISRIKFGYLQSEKSLFKDLDAYFEFNGHRNPVSFILEAADDIAFRAADIEDSVKLGILSINDIIRIFEKNLGVHKKEFVAFVEKTKLELVELRDSNPSLYEFILAQKIRIHTQTIMIREVEASFTKHYQEIMDGVFNDELLNSSDSNDLNNAYRNLFERVLEDKKILRLEITGYQVINGLLEMFVPAVLSKNRTGFQDHLYKMISDEQRFIYENRHKSTGGEPSDYQKLLLVTDYISGMTDSFALDLYQRLSGIRI